MSTSKKYRGPKSYPATDLYPAAKVGDTFIVTAGTLKGTTGTIEGFNPGGHSVLPSMFWLGAIAITTK